MALGIVVLSRKPAGGETEVVAEVTLDNSYPTGGEAYVPATDFGILKLNFLGLLGVNAGGKLVEHDRVNKKFVVKFFDYTAGASGAAIEVANASDQSTVKFTVVARGKSAKAFTA